MLGHSRGSIRDFVVHDHGQHVGSENQMNEKIDQPTPSLDPLERSFTMVDFDGKHSIYTLDGDNQ